MGMTYELFWEMDCELVKDYREAFKIRQQQQNYAAWLQGLYVYEAICDVSPILQAFAKRGTKPRAYSEKPYELTPARPDKNDMERKMKRGVAHMEALAARFNRSFERKKTKEVADHV